MRAASRVRRAVADPSFRGKGNVCLVAGILALVFVHVHPAAGIAGTRAYRVPVSKVGIQTVARYGNRMLIRRVPRRNVADRNLLAAAAAAVAVAARLVNRDAERFVIGIDSVRDSDLNEEFARIFGLRLHGQDIPGYRYLSRGGVRSRRLHVEQQCRVLVVLHRKFRQVGARRQPAAPLVKLAVREDNVPV